MPILLSRKLNSAPTSNSLLVPPNRLGFDCVFGTANLGKDPYAVPTL